MTQQHQRILCLRDHPEWSERAAVWFHKKMGHSIDGLPREHPSLPEPAERHPAMAYSIE